MLPFGFPLKLQTKREMKHTRLRLRQISFLIRFVSNLSGSLQAQFVRRYLIWSCCFAVHFQHRFFV
jgi:hypothetical protein